MKPTKDADTLARLLRDARNRLIEWIGTDCECDNTHEAVSTTCCLCEYAAALGLDSEDQT